MSRTKRTTILTIAAVATLLAALATPVSAKKPDKPTPTVEIVKVSMGFVGGSSGLATDKCGGSLEMNVEAAGRLRVDWADAETEVEMKLLDNDGGTLLEGCHGWRPVPGDAFAGYFILKAKPDGTVELTSRFDYKWDETVTGGKKKPRVVVQVQDLYQIDVLLERTDSEPFDWAASGPQEVTGDLELSHFARADGGWQDPIIVHDFVMTITILPSD